MPQLFVPRARLSRVPRRDSVPFDTWSMPARHESTTWTKEKAQVSTRGQRPWAFPLLPCRAIGPKANRDRRVRARRARKEVQMKSRYLGRWPGAAVFALALLLVLPEAALA